MKCCERRERRRERERERLAIIVFHESFVHVHRASFSVEGIEVMDTVVVSAFGRPIPVMKPR